jgi:hypothetical protein
MVLSQNIIEERISKVIGILLLLKTMTTEIVNSLKMVVF